MKKIKHHIKKHKKNILYIFLGIFFISLLIGIATYKYQKNLSSTGGMITKEILDIFTEPKDVQLNLLFSGDIFFGRGVNAKAMASSTSLFAYPFSGLDTFEKENYDAWVGNLECPVTKEQSTKYESEVYLKLSCRPEYLSEMAKYFDIVSLANNHTDNINGRKGIEETRINLEKNGIEYFGDYDNSQTENVCNIIYTKNIPIAYCGYHGVYKLPTEKELEIIKEYSKYFITIVMPHQGEEYIKTSNSYQKKIYRQMIDNGADLVIGSHPHVIEEVEEYKGKVIFYSLGNFIFDQIASETRKHLSVDAEILFPKYENNYKDLNCEKIDALICLEKAENLKIKKPEFTIKYTPIFTYSGKDMITKKEILTDKEYQTKLRQIGFDKLPASFKATSTIK